MIALVPQSTTSFSQEKRPNSQPPIRLQTCATQPKLLVRVREAIRTRHSVSQSGLRHSRRTQQSYVHWVKRFIFFHGKRHPAEMGELEINRFLTDLAVDKKVSSSTQNQALSALLFLYQKVLGISLGNLGNVIRARRPRRMPVVLSREEVTAALAQMDGVPRLVCALLYGAGLRLLECLCLRVKDVDFGRNEITVRVGKGGKDRITMLPMAIKQGLQVGKIAETYFPVKPTRPKNMEPVIELFSAALGCATNRTSTKG